MLHVVYPIRVMILIIVVFTVGQLGETIYIPAMPSIKEDCGCGREAVQLILSSFLFAYGGSQLVYGPISDCEGRRKVVLFGVLLFVIGAILCFFSVTINQLIASAFVLGAGIGCSGAMCRTILRDLYSGNELQRAMSIVGISLVVVPFISPVLGSYLSQYIHWRADFALMGILGAICWILCFFYLEETNKYIEHSKLNLHMIMVRYKEVLKNKIFMGNMLCGLYIYALAVVYETSVTFLLQEDLGYSSVEFAWFAIIPILGFLLGTLVSTYIGKKIAPNWLTIIGICFTALSSVLMLILALGGYLSVTALIAPMVVFLFGSGFLFASTTSEALMPFTYSAGIAASTMGAFHNIGVALTAAIMSYAKFISQLSLSVCFVVLTTLTIITFFGLVYPQWKTVEQMDKPI